MPKKLSFEKIEKNKYSFDSSITLTTNSTCYIRTPIDLGRQIPKGKKVKVTIEVIDDEKKN